jgi:gliding motility-associated-like protein
MKRNSNTAHPKSGRDIMKRFLSFVVILLAVKVTAFAQPTISFPNASPCTEDGSASFCMDVTVKDFTDILSMEFTIAWDPEVIRFDEVTNESLPALNETNFDLTKIDSGFVTLKWRINDCSSGITGVTLEDGKRIFTLCFTALGNYGANTKVEIINKPVDIKVTRVNACPNNIGLFTDPGFVSTCVRPLELTASHEEANPGDLICVDFAVGGFDNLTSMQFSINWDPSILKFENVIPLGNLVNLSKSGFGTPEDPDIPEGSVTVSWAFVDPSDNSGVTLEDGTQIFQICFEAVGQCERSSAIFFSGMPTPIEVTNTIVEGFELPVLTEEGSIQLGDCNPTGLQLIADCGGPVQINDEVCVQVTTANFADLLEMEFLMQWNPNILKFNRVDKVNTGIAGLGQNDFIKDNVENGVLGFQWETLLSIAQTVPDGTLFFEVCFDVVGLGGDSPFRFPASPARVRTTTQNNIGIAPSNCAVQVIQPEGIGIFIDDAEGSPGDTVCVDFAASNFEDILSMQYSLAWDTTHIQYLNIENNLPEPGAANIGLAGIDGGSLTVDWEPSQSYTLEDGTVYMTLCFVVSGSPKECQLIEIIDVPIVQEVVSDSSNGNNIGLTAQGGEVCVLIPNGFTLAIGQEEGFLDDTVCVPFKVADFEGVTDIEFTASWDPSALQYLELRTTGALPFDPISNFETNSTGVGLLGFNYQDADGATLADSTVLFEICYILLGPKNECYEITLEEGDTTSNFEGEGSITLEPGGICVRDRFLIENVQISPVNCPGGDDGAIELTVSGGTGTIFFNWGSDPVQFGNRARNLEVGPIAVTIFDSNDPALVMKDTFEITLSRDLPFADAGPDRPATCDPEIFLLDGQGNTTPEYTYQWSTVGGSLPGDRESLVSVGQGAGLYILEVRNTETFCVVRDTVEIFEPDAPLVDGGQDRIFDCSIDTLQLNGSGSAVADTITHKWTALDGGMIVPGEDTLLRPRITEPGTFVLQSTFTTTGCSATDTVFVDDRRVFPDAKAGSDVELSCSEDFVLLDGSGSVNTEPVTYRWLNENGDVLAGSVTLQATDFGTYFLQVTHNQSGCVSTDSVEVVPSDEFPVVNAGSDDILTCTNDTLTLSAEVTNAPDFTFQWQMTNGGEIIAGTENSLNPKIAVAGTYQLVVTNTENQCTASDSLVITANQVVPVAEAGAGTTLTCNAPSFTLDGTGTSVGESISYTWTLDGQTVALDTLKVNISSAGTYLLEVTDRDNGCTAQDFVEVINDAEAPQITPDPASTLNCQQSVATVSAAVEPAAADLSMQWEAVNGNGHIIGGATGPSIEVDEAGIYRLTVFNNDNGCEATAEVEVNTDVNYPVADAGEDQLITCQDSVVTLGGSNTSAGMPFTYQWTAISGGTTPEFDDSMEAQTDATGTYELLVTNTENGCVKRDTVEVTENTTPPQVSVADPEILTCTMDTIQLDGTASEFGDNYVAEWSPDGGQQTISTQNPLIVKVTQPGNYQLLVRNARTGCEATTSVTVETDASVPTADAGSDKVLTCPGQPLTLDGSNSSTGPDISYEWTVVQGIGTINNPSSLMPTVDQAGTYQLLVLNTSNGCNAMATVAVTEHPSLVPADAGEDISTCDTESMLFAQISAGATGQWTTSSGAKIETPGQPSSFVSGLSNGDNTFVWTVSLSNCPNYSSDEVIVRKEIAPVPNNDLANVPIGARELNIDVAANDQLNTNREWKVTILSQPMLGRVDSAVGGTVRYIPNPGIFGSDEFSYELCNLSCPGLCDSAFVQVIIEYDEDYQPQLPNAITPNGDGTNDELIFDILENAIDFWPDNELIIFNRWGDIVYSAKPYANNWRGLTDSGQQLPDGTYYYILRLDISNGVIYKGDITILK